MVRKVDDARVCVNVMKRKGAECEVHRRARTNVMMVTIQIPEAQMPVALLQF